MGAIDKVCSRNGLIRKGMTDVDSQRLKSEFSPPPPPPPKYTFFPRKANSVRS